MAHTDHTDDPGPDPRPVSDPEAEGLPATADDDSFADEAPESSRVADGPDPAALPADEPVAVFDHGTTAAENLEGESLDGRLAREEPDIGPDDVAEPASPLDDVGRTSSTRSAGATDRSASDAGLTDEPVLEPGAEESLSFDDPAAEPEIGRLVQPDGGAHTDVDADEIARDVGTAGGGLSAEESAMHVEPE